jgi:septal ring factor EnvC (AmiA/AmiB activator)
MAHGWEICALEEEIGRVGKAIEMTGMSLGQQEGEWKAAIGDLHKKAAQERSEVSGLKEVLVNPESRHEKLREIVATQGDELAETRRQNMELGGRLQQLEEENRLHRKSSEGLKDHLARVEAGQQSEVAV